MPKKKDIMQFQRVRRYVAGVAAVNAAADAAAVAVALAAHGKKLDLDMVAYNGLTATNQAIVDAALLTGKAVEDYADRDALAVVFEPILYARAAAEFAVGMVNAALSAVRMDAVIVQYAETLGLELDAYNLLTDKNKETVCDDMLTGKPYANEAAVKIAFDAAVATELETQAVAAVNAADNTVKMSAALFTYADVLEIDVSEESDYTALEPEKQSLVLEAMVSGQSYDDAEAIKTAFEAAVAAQQEE